jgi:hypothetical protein
VVAVRCVSFDTSLTLEELLAVIALGEIEVMAPLLRKDEGSVSVEEHVMSLIVLPVGLGGPSDLSGGAAWVGAKL